MSEAEGEGHLYLKREDIIERVEKLLNHNKDVSLVSERAIRDTGNDMITFEKEHGENWELLPH